METGLIIAPKERDFYQEYRRFQQDIKLWHQAQSEFIKPFHEALFKIIFGE